MQLAAASCRGWTPAAAGALFRTCLASARMGSQLSSSEAIFAGPEHDYTAGFGSPVRIEASAPQHSSAHRGAYVLDWRAGDYLKSVDPQPTIPDPVARRVARQTQIRTLSLWRMGFATRSNGQYLVAPVPVDGMVYCTGRLRHRATMGVNSECGFPRLPGALHHPSQFRKATASAVAYWCW